MIEMDSEEELRRLKTCEKNLKFLMDAVDAQISIREGDAGAVAHIERHTPCEIACMEFEIAATTKALACMRK